MTEIKIVTTQTIKTKSSLDSLETRIIKLMMAGGSDKNDVEKFLLDRDFIIITENDNIEVKFEG